MPTLNLFIHGFSLLGHDAMNLITYLHQMARNEFLTFPGKTGYLRVNSEGIVVRNLNKYRIKNGRVKLAEVDQRGLQ